MTGVAETRFWAKVDVRGPDDCWQWQAATTRGHGRFGVAPGDVRLAHRYSYGLAFGALEPDTVLHHECRNPGCVNPLHLRPMTQSEHMHIHGETFNSAKTHCAAGHPYEGDNLYVNPRGHRFCRTCQRDARRRYKARKRAERIA
jgi:hypothetical protein